MSNVNVASIVEDMRKLYQKDKKAQAIICAGDEIKTEYESSDTIPLPPAHPLRVLLALPGIPFNKIVQVAGKPDCGKSTWAGEIMVSAQKSGAQVIVWDSEDKLDANRFTVMGGDPSQLLVIKTNEILKGAELVRRYITAVKKQAPSAKVLLVWDSVGGSQSRSHAERELDSEKHAQPGQDAKENGSVMKMLVALINKYPDDLAVYLVNQTYAKIGFMQHGDATSGGTKLEYHSSAIIMLKRIKVLTRTVQGVLIKYGIITRATVAKNHLSQSKTSVHQLDFTVTAAGSEVTDSVDEGENANE